MRGMSKLWVVCFSLLVVCCPARAADFTDVWTAPEEPGWAVYVSQQDDTVAVGLLVYGADRKPLWVTGALDLFAITGSGGLPLFAGPLYVSEGPHFAGAFDPAQVTRRAVGRGYFLPDSPTTAKLQYEIDGVTVMRNVARLTFRTKLLGGQYRYVQRFDQWRCNASGQVERRYENGTLRVEQSDTTLSMRFESERAQCLYFGNLAQKGKYGEAQGNFLCSDGLMGTFKASELNLDGGRLSGKLGIAPASCGETGGSFSALSLQ